MGGVDSGGLGEAITSVLGKFKPEHRLRMAKVSLDLSPHMPGNKVTECTRILCCARERLPDGFAGEFARACDTRARYDQGGSRTWGGGGRQGRQGHAWKGMARVARLRGSEYLGKYAVTRALYDECSSER